jgi:ankyrin repeat protein
MERQFQTRFKSEGSFNEQSAIWLCTENLPPALEKNALYVLKTLDKGYIHLSVHRLGESSRMLSQTTCQNLLNLPHLASFPKTAENPIRIARLQYGRLFQKIVSLCGYVLGDMPRPRENFHHIIKAMEGNLLALHQTLDAQKASYQLLQDLSQWFIPTPVIKDFLTHYMTYQKQREKETTLASLNAQHCLQQAEAFEVDSILKANNDDRNTIQETLELLLWGVPPKTYLSKKIGILLTLCKAYQQEGEAKVNVLIPCFEQFLKLAQKYPQKSSEIETILKQILLDYCAQSTYPPAFERLLLLYLENFQINAEECQHWFHTVVKMGHLNATQCLLNKGADITSRNDKGQTVIFVASLQQNIALLKMLLTHHRLDLRKNAGLLCDAKQNHILRKLLQLPYTLILLDIIKVLSHYGAVYPLPSLHYDYSMPSQQKLPIPLEDNNFQRLVGELTFQSVLDLSFFASIDQNSLPFKLLKTLLDALSSSEKQACLLLSSENETLLTFILHQYGSQWDKVKLILSYFIPEETPLHEAILASCIQMNHPTLLAFLLERCKAPIDLNAPLAKKKTWLHLAIESRQPKIVELLLKHQADPQQASWYVPHSSGTNQRSLSHISRQQLAQQLYLSDDFIIGTSSDQGGAFFDAFAQVVNNLQGAPLQTEASSREICYRYYQKNIAEVLVLHQADKMADIAYDRVRFTAEKLTQGKTFVGRPWVEGIILCRALNLEVIYLAEIEGAFEETPDALNASSLNQAAHIIHQGTELKIRYYAITQKAYQPIQKVEMPDDVPFLLFSSLENHYVPVFKPQWTTPLQLSVLENQLPSIQCLLAARPKLALRTPDIKNRTVFHLAALTGHLEMLKTLEKQMATSDKYDWLLDTDSGGNTPFLLAIQYQRLDCAQWMLSVVEKYTQEHRSESPFPYMRVLTTPNHQGQTPLLLAIQSHKIPLVQVLLTRCAHQFWQDEVGQSAVQSLLSDKEIPETVLHELKASKIKAGIELIKKQLYGLLSQDLIHKHFLEAWGVQLEKVLQEPRYQTYRETLMDTPLSAVQVMAEPLAKRIAHTIQEKYHSPEHKAELQAHISTQTYHAWTHILHQAIDKMLLSVSHQVHSHLIPSDSIFSRIDKKTDKHRAFTRALKDALRNYFYVSRALYEGKVLMNDEGFNAFKAIFNVASPIATEISATLTNVNVGVISGFVSAALELVTRLRDAKYQCEAGRFVQAFGLCQPDAIEKCKKDISIDHDKLKAVAESLYQRYRDQIEQCTLSKEADISLRLADTDGIYVLATIMADRIFQHIIKKESTKVEDDRTVLKQISDWFETLGADNDIYKELSLISLPERCILAVIYECVGEDKDAPIRTDRWLRNGCNTEDVWMAGGILVKTGLKLERNPTELYIRAGNDEQKSLHLKYGYCYVSDAMVYLKEIEKRGFIKASQTHVDRLVDPLTPTDQKTVAPCFVM